MSLRTQRLASTDAIDPKYQSWFQSMRFHVASLPRRCGVRFTQDYTISSAIHPSERDVQGGNLLDWTRRRPAFRVRYSLALLMAVTNAHVIKYS